MVASTTVNIFNLESNALSTTLGLLGHQQEDQKENVNSSSLLLMDDVRQKNNGTFDRIAITIPTDNAATATTLSSCRIMIYSKTFDGHYEVFESIARKYPLPFSSTTKCQHAGLTPENPIVVDFVMPFQWQGGYKQEDDTNNNGAAAATNKKKKKGKGTKKTGGGAAKKNKGFKQSEGWGWTRYFQQHLQNTTVQRIVRSENDDNGGRYIYYANVLGLTKRSFQNISWKSYSFMIEASCDMWGNHFWKDWLAKDKKRHYCVFHRKHEKKKLAKSAERRTCYLNPQFEQDHHCWFLPTVYPKFPKPAAPFTEASPKLNICIGWKSMGKGTHYLRDESLLVRALSNLSNNMWHEDVSSKVPSNQFGIREKLQVLVIGRNARVPEAFVQAKLGTMVQVHNNMVAFYEYQQLIATKCHALIPLVHPEQTAYFLTPAKSQVDNDGSWSNQTTSRHNGQGRLSGMIAQLIGNRIPSLVHAAVADIYQGEFTAPYFVYNSTKDGGEAFQFALEGLIDYYYRSSLGDGMDATR